MRKKKLVKMIALLLGTIIIGNSLIACQTNDANDTVTEGGVENGSPSVGPLEPFLEPITVTVAQRTFGDAIPIGEDSPWIQKYRDFGINIEVAWSADAGQFDDRLNTAIASGDVPDIFQVSASSHVNTLVRANMVADLTDVFERYASDTVRERFSTPAGQAALEAATFEGRLRFIPINITESLNDMDLLYIRKDWVENLGMEMPTTMEEVAELAVAFTHDDPDGNGQDDTYGIAMPGRWGIDAIRSFFTAFGVFPGTWHDGMIFYTYDDNGEIVWSGEKDGMVEGLEMLQDLFAEGAIAQDFANYDGTMAGEDLNGGRAGITIGARGFPAWHIQNTYINNPDAIWYAMKVPPAAGHETLVAGFQPMNAAIAVSADFEHPEAIIKMLNIVTEIHTIGSDMFEPFYQESNRNEAGDSFMVPIHEPSWERIQTEAIANAVINDASAELDEGSLMIYENIRLFEETGDPSAWTDWNRFYPASGHAYYVLYVLNGDATITRNLWQQLPSPSMQSNLAIWRNMADEAFVRIVAGADVSEWQDLVDAWAGLGGDEIKEAIASQQ